MERFMKKWRAKLGAFFWIVLAVLLMALNLGARTVHGAEVPTEQVTVTSCRIDGSDVRIEAANAGAVSGPD